MKKSGTTSLAARGATAEQSDEAVAAAAVGGEVIGQITRAEWYGAVVWRAAAVSALLEISEYGDERHAKAVLPRALTQLVAESGVTRMRCHPELSQICERRTALVWA